MKKRINAFGFILTALFVFACVSCAPGKQGTGNQEPGKEGETGKGVALGNWEREGYGFVKEGLSVSGNVSSFRTVFLTGDRIYYTLISAEGEPGFYCQENGIQKELPIVLPSEEGSTWHVESLSVDGGGMVWVLYRPVGKERYSACFLAKYTQQG